jgi:hypothetical protein
MILINHNDEELLVKVLPVHLRYIFSGKMYSAKSLNLEKLRLGAIGSTF